MQKSETEEPKKENKFEQCDETTQSTQDSFYSWSGVSQSIDIKGEKREWSSDDEEEKPWWESFKSQSTEETSFQLSQPSSSQQTETSQSQQENDDNEQDDETEKISFYLKLGKNKKFKFM